MRKISTALISVFDKKGLVPFAKGLRGLGIRIISTGQTARVLKKAGIRCTEVSKITSFPEMLDGRVKTLHPRIHAGVLAVRTKPEHMGVLKKYKIPQIDMVVVNLYPFADVARSGAGLDAVIEMIDIGGPTLIRAAAKNYTSVAPVCDINDYMPVLRELKENEGALGSDQLKKLSAKAFQITAAYDTHVAQYLSSDGLAFRGEPGTPSAAALPGTIKLDYEKVRDLRYGENPHQRGALYRAVGFRTSALPSAEVLGGKELSFNNYLDMETAWMLAGSFGEPAACVIKHNGPCGVAVDRDVVRAFRSAFACDPLSAFGGIVGLNRKVDRGGAKAILKAGFLECIVAPDYSDEALELLRSRKNLRLVKVPFRLPSAKERRPKQLDYKRITGGLLLQDCDWRDVGAGDLKAVTHQKPTQIQVRDLLFAFKVCRFVKSNSIVLVKGRKTVGIGGGQPSRIDSALIAFRKAGRRARGAVLASDGFFPKTDSIEAASRHGIRAVVQPGGSIQDQPVVDACNRLKIPMVFTGIRHFTH